MQRTVGRQVAASVVVLGLVALAGCATGDSAVRQCQETFSQTMQADSNHFAYGMGLLARSDSEFAKQMIVDAIRSDSAQTAREAVKAIVDTPPEAAREALQEVFANKGGLLKLNAARALAALGDEQARAFISEESLSGGATLTPAIAELLAEGDSADELKKILAKRIESDEQSIRDEAYGLLGSIGQPWATSVLITGLGKERGESRQQAIVALGRTGDPAVAPRLHKFVNTKGLVFATLEALGDLGNPDSLKTVQKMTDHEEPLVRVYAVTAAWKLGDEETALAALPALAADEDPRVRVNVAQQVRSIDNPAATDLLKSLLADDDHDVRLEAIRGLAARADAGMAQVFVDALGDKSYEVSTSALDALAEFGGEAALEPIQAKLESKNPYVVMSAANAVLEIKNRTAPAA